MIEREKILAVAERLLEGSDMFVVECNCSPSNEIELVVDSDSSVSIESCVNLSNAVNEAFDRDEEDFSLTVSSAGIGSPLKVYRQYAKLVGRPVELLLENGTKILATLTGAEPDAITLSYEDKVAVEGKKRKQKVTVVNRYPLEEVRWTKEYLDYK